MLQSQTTILVHQGVKPIHTLMSNGGAKGAKGHVVVYMQTQRGMYKHALVLVHTAHQLSQASRAMCKLNAQQAGGVEIQEFPLNNADILTCCALLWV